MPSLVPILWFVNKSTWVYLIGGMETVRLEGLRGALGSVIIYIFIKSVIYLIYYVRLSMSSPFGFVWNVQSVGLKHLPRASAASCDQLLDALIVAGCCWTTGYNLGKRRLQLRSGGRVVETCASFTLDFGFVDQQTVSRQRRATRRVMWF